MAEHEHEKPPPPGLLAGFLAAASAVGAGYASAEVAQAAVKMALKGAGLGRRAVSALAELHSGAPAPVSQGLTPAVRAQLGHAHAYRAAYLLAAARRVARAAKPSTPSTVGDALTTEKRYFAQHRTATAQRAQAAQRVDAAANAYGPLLGWYAEQDSRTTPECAAAHGRNYDITRPPEIGLPGLKHAGRCRCRPGPPHPGAAMVGETPRPPARPSTQIPEPSVVAAARQEATVLDLATSRASLDRSPRKNWVENSGGLPPYVRQIARSIEREQGVTLSRAIQLAIGAVQRWARGGDEVSASTRAKAARAVAQWETAKARNRTRQVSTARDEAGVELASYKSGGSYHHVPGTAYNWRHGFRPLNVQTALLHRKRAAAKALHAEGAPHAAPEPGWYHRKNPGKPKTIAADKKLGGLDAAPKPLPQIAQAKKSGKHMIVTPVGKLKEGQTGTALTPTGNTAKVKIAGVGKEFPKGGQATQYAYTDLVEIVKRKQDPIFDSAADAGEFATAKANATGAPTYIVFKPGPKYAVSATKPASGPSTKIAPTVVPARAPLTGAGATPPAAPTVTSDPDKDLTFQGAAFAAAVAKKKAKESGSPYYTVVDGTKYKVSATKPDGPHAVTSPDGTVTPSGASTAPAPPVTKFPPKTKPTAGMGPTATLLYNSPTVTDTSTPNAAAAAAMQKAMASGKPHYVQATKDAAGYPTGFAVTDVKPSNAATFETYAPDASVTTVAGGYPYPMPVSNAKKKVLAGLASQQPAAAPELDAIVNPTPPPAPETGVPAGDEKAFAGTLAGAYLTEAQPELGNWTSVGADFKAKVGKIPEAEYKAMNFYTGSGYASVNPLIRKGEAVPPVGQEMMAGLDPLMDRYVTDKPMVLRRGHKAKYFPPENMAGKVYNDAGYGSTSFEKGFGGEVRWRILAPAGTRGVPTSGAGGGVFGSSETEFILPRDSQFFIEKDEIVNGTRHVVATLVPTPTNPTGHGPQGDAEGLGPGAYSPAGIKLLQSQGRQAWLTRYAKGNMLLARTEDRHGRTIDLARRRADLERLRRGRHRHPRRSGGAQPRGDAGADGERHRGLPRLPGRAAVELAWDPAEHPRNPRGTAGGGRFRSKALPGPRLVPTGGGRAVRPMDKQALNERVARLQAVLRETPSTTERYRDAAGQWDPDRERQHDEVVDALYARAAGIPQEGRSILAGGLGGAGKSTVLGRDPRTAAYFTLNPDEVKEEMARRGMAPELPGFSPLEASSLMHEESGHITDLLAARAYADRRNVVWDITMSSDEVVRDRLDELDAHGYGEVVAVFVDIDVETSVTRAMSRYAAGVVDFEQGRGLGGRFVPPEVIRSNTDPDYSSRNRRTFEAYRDRFDRADLYDARSGSPRLVGPR